MQLSFNNDKKLKSMMLAEMKIHAKQDAFIKGTYFKMNGHFKGCAVGCGVYSLNKKLNLKLAYGDHAGYSKALGIPEWLAQLEDQIFEGLPTEDSKLWPQAFLKAIPVGYDLEPVKWKFCAFILKENIERVLTLDISDDLKKQVVDAIRGVLNLHENAVTTGNWDESAVWSVVRSAAWSAAESAARSAAESAARSAAESAARSAESAWSAARSAESAWSAAESAAESAAWSAAESARSAAWSAARSAARSAAWSAAFQRYSKELLRLLKDVSKHERRVR